MHLIYNADGLKVRGDAEAGIQALLAPHGETLGVLAPAKYLAGIANFYDQVDFTDFRHFYQRAVDQALLAKDFRFALILVEPAGENGRLLHLLHVSKYRCYYEPQVVSASAEVSIQLSRDTFPWPTP